MLKSWTFFPLQVKRRKLPELLVIRNDLVIQCLRRHHHDLWQRVSLFMVRNTQYTQLFMCTIHTTLFSHLKINSEFTFESPLLFSLLFSLFLRRVKQRMRKRIRKTRKGLNTEGERWFWNYKWLKALRLKWMLLFPLSLEKSPEERRWWKRWWSCNDQEMQETTEMRN